jgi:hypothetical protein
MVILNWSAPSMHVPVLPSYAYSLIFYWCITV